MRIRIQPIHLKFNEKEESNIYLPFFISYYNPTVQKVQNSQFYLYALSLLAGSGSGTIIPDPYAGKSSGSLLIRIRNTEKNAPIRTGFRKLIPVSR